MKQRYVVFAVLLSFVLMSGCQAVYFVLPAKYENQLKTRKKQREVEKMQKQQTKEEERKKENLREQWLEMQSNATREQMKRLEKKAKKINKKRRRRFFLWRWLGI